MLELMESLTTADMGIEHFAGILIAMVVGLALLDLLKSAGPNKAKGLQRR